ncbi:MAG TPA: NAD-dependent epimerase/dehydratase family protein [Chloroflexota bacterium]|nr:NAD-dependent epimerase/dehydratase family protein [Chloroflexota bacterium]
MKILITGASGFLGSHLCRRLLQEGHEVTALCRPESDDRAIEDLNPRRVLGDVTNPAEIRQAVAGQDAVIHAAGNLTYWRGVRAAQTRVNVDGTCNVARACREAGVSRLVHVSSVAAIGIPGRGQGPADERFSFNLGSTGLNYHVSKALAEQAVRQEIDRGLDAVIVNPGSIFGPFRGHYRGGEMIAKVRGRRVVPSFVGGISVVHVEDVVDGIARVLEHGRRGERYILGGENLSYRQIVEIAAQQLGEHPIMVPFWPIATGVMAALFEPLGALTGRRPRMTFDVHYCSQRNQFYRSDKARTELGYRARPFASIVREYIEWSTQRRMAIRPESREARRA